MENNYANLFKYKITYSKNRKKTIAFKVRDDVLNIISPKGISENFLMKLIEKRKFWTIERINAKKERRKLIENNKILLLGKELDIDIKENLLLKNGGFCEYSNDKLIVNISKSYSEEILENIIKSWYKTKCLSLIKERVEFYSNAYNFKYNKITIKEQKTVWGTCNSNNDLTFNWKVIFFDINVVDYLVIHELTHTIYKNHSKDYWEKVKSIIPNYKELNGKLKNNFAF